MLHISNARVDYGPVRAFSNFTLDASPGEMVSIIGKSGCGKTSLLYAAAGLLELTEGSITLAEQPAVIMFQQDRLLPWKHVLDNVLLGLGQQELIRAEHLLDQVGLGDKLYHYPHQLSGGERQRTALARSLIRAPRVLLLDEPLAALDEQTREHLQDVIKEFVLELGITMLLVTHSIQEAIFMGSKVVVMRSGGISFTMENPLHTHGSLREHSEFFQMERLLRAELKESI